MNRATTHKVATAGLILAAVYGLNVHAKPSASSQQGQAKQVSSKVRSVDDCEAIRQAIAALPEAGGTVNLEAKTYNCTALIAISRNNVTLKGAGEGKTILRLADYSHAPLLVIGDTEMELRNGEWLPAKRISNVRVSDMTLDGNLSNQNPWNECGNHHCDGDVKTIRNNSITIRGASDIYVENVTAHDAISGGMVTEKYCFRLHVKNFKSYGNHFDGFAGYQTEDSLFENMHLYKNRAAGISLDVDFQNNEFRNSRLNDNGDVGIFARDVRNLLFNGIDIKKSGNHGVYMSQSDGPESCTSFNEFRNLVVENSNGHGFHLGSVCDGNTITGDSKLSRNRFGCYYFHEGATVQVSPQTKCEK